MSILAHAVTRPRWPGALAALALLAAPAALPAQRRAEPVDLATLVAASRTCREGPADAGEAARHIRSQGWQPSDGGLPANLRAMLPIPMFEREQILLILIEPAMGGPGECEVVASVRSAPAWPDIVAALTADFGRPPESSSESQAHWMLDQRSADANIDRGTVHVAFSLGAAQPRAAPASPPAPAPDTSPAQAKPSAMPEPVTEAPAPAPAPAAATAPAGDIAAAATLCVAAFNGSRVDTGAIERAGWTGAGGRYSHAGGNVAIFATRTQCVVDAYGERTDSFDAIRDAIRAGLTARFGAQAALGEALGAEGDFSRGQGFTVGSRIGVLSSEQRDTGLSIRFTVMSFR